ncbi:MAG: ice-binding family protein [Myxococcota bacterium]|nr:ice-binding family protein [Myxococcota bacterium]
MEENQAASAAVDASQSEANPDGDGRSESEGQVCNPATPRCLGNTPQTCDVKGQWQAPRAPCAYVCNNGRCTGSCTPLSKECSGNTPQTCDSTGAWVHGVACANLCSNGACAGSCVASGAQCSGNRPQTCDSSANWASGQACSYVCANGACTGVCSPNSTQCSGDAPQTCGAAGQWVSGSVCPYVCSAGSCAGVCVPNSAQCIGPSNATPQICNNAGQWVSGSIREATCGAACTPGTSAPKCTGNTPQTCGANGQWQNGISCPRACSDGSCNADAGVEGGTVVPPALGTAATFAVLAGSTITNAGAATALVGDVGISPGTALVALTTWQITGTIHLGDATAMQAEADLTTAYNDLAGRPCQHAMTSIDLGGKTLAPGVYCFAVSAAQMVGDLTLDGQGDPNAVWIFQIGSTLTVASNLSTTMINAGNACNVYWQVGSSATINVGAQFKGNVLAQASISLLTGANVSPGRTLTQTAAVTMQSSAISNTGCP